MIDVIFNMFKLLIFLLNIAALSFAERGDLISFEYKDQKTSNQIQYELENSDASQLNPNAIYNIKSYSIVYETIDQFGQVTQASGSVVIPDDNNFAYPIYLFGHGTQIRRASAPSMNGFNVLNMWVSTAGYIFVEPDYLGLGISEGLHPYHLKDVTASTMIDMLYASKKLCSQLSDVANNEQLFIAGYSEGGYAAMATVKEIEDNFSDIDITMSFPMAGAYDLSGTMVDLMLSEEEYADPFYLPFFVLSYIEKYNLGTLDMFFKSEYAQGFPEWFNGEHSGGYINSFLPSIPIHMMLPEVVEEFEINPDFEFKLRLQDNDLTNWTPQNPMYLYHGISDERVPYNNSVVAFESLGGDNNPNLYFETLGESYGGHQEAAPYCLIGAFIKSEEVKIINEKGDSNADNILNVLDVIELIDFILEGVDFDGLQLWVIDMNDDNQLNIFDIVLLVERIIQNG